MIPFDECDLEERYRRVCAALAIHRREECTQLTDQEMAEILDLPPQYERLGPPESAPPSKDRLRKVLAIGRLMSTPESLAWETEIADWLQVPPAPGKATTLLIDLLNRGEISLDGLVNPEARDSLVEDIITIARSARETLGP